MAWTELDTNGLLPGEPWTSAKALAVYENVEAAFSGDTGAPRLHGDAVGTRFNNGLPVLTVSAASTYTASNSSFGYTRGPSSLPPSSAYTIVATYENSLYTGSMRFQIDHARTGSIDGGSIIGVFVDGSFVAEVPQHRSNTFTTASFDVSILPSETITLRQFILPACPLPWAC